MTTADDRICFSHLVRRGDESTSNTLRASRSSAQLFSTTSNSVSTFTSPAAHFSRKHLVVPQSRVENLVMRHRSKPFHVRSLHDLLVVLLTCAPAKSFNASIRVRVSGVALAHSRNNIAAIKLPRYLATIFQAIETPIHMVTVCMSSPVGLSSPTWLAQTAATLLHTVKDGKEPLCTREHLQGIVVHRQNGFVWIGAAWFFSAVFRRCCCAVLFFVGLARLFRRVLCFCFCWNCWRRRVFLFRFWLRRHVRARRAF